MLMTKLSPLLFTTFSKIVLSFSPSILLKSWLVTIFFITLFRFPSGQRHTLSYELIACPTYILIPNIQIFARNFLINLSLNFTTERASSWLINYSTIEHYMIWIKDLNKIDYKYRKLPTKRVLKAQNNKLEASLRCSREINLGTKLPVNFIHTYSTLQSRYINFFLN